MAMIFWELIVDIPDLRDVRIKHRIILDTWQTSLLSTWVSTAFTLLSNCNWFVLVWKVQNAVMREAAYTNSQSDCLASRLCNGARNSQWLALSRIIATAVFGSQLTVCVSWASAADTFFSVLYGIVQNLSVLAVVCSSDQLPLVALAVLRRQKNNFISEDTSRNLFT